MNNPKLFIGFQHKLNTNTNEYPDKKIQLFLNHIHLHVHPRGNGFYVPIHIKLDVLYDTISKLHNSNL